MKLFCNSTKCHKRRKKKLITNWNLPFDAVITRLLMDIFNLFVSLGRCIMKKWIFFWGSLRVSKWENYQGLSAHFVCWRRPTATTTPCRVHKEIKVQLPLAAKPLKLQWIPQKYIVNVIAPTHFPLISVHASIDILILFFFCFLFSCPRSFDSRMNRTWQVSEWERERKRDKGTKRKKPEFCI